MTIFVDPIFYNVTVAENPRAAQYGAHWCHLLCDGDVEELHSFAKLIELRRSWFQAKIIPYYYLTPTKRKVAISQGAVEKSRKELSLLNSQWLARWNGGKPDWKDAL